MCGVLFSSVLLSFFPFLPSNIVVDAEGFVELRERRHQGPDDHGVLAQMHRAEDRATEDLEKLHSFGAKKLRCWNVVTWRTRVVSLSLYVLPEARSTSETSKPRVEIKSRGFCLWEVDIDSPEYKSICSSNFPTTSYIGIPHGSPPFF